MTSRQKGLEGVKVALSSVDESVALSSVDESVPLSSADESVALSSVDESVALSSADESAGDTSTPGTRALHADRLRVALRVGPSAGRRAPPPRRRAGAPTLFLCAQVFDEYRATFPYEFNYTLEVRRPPPPLTVQLGRAAPPTSYKVDAHLPPPRTKWTRTSPHLYKVDAHLPPPRTKWTRISLSPHLLAAAAGAHGALGAVAPRPAGVSGGLQGRTDCRLFCSRFAAFFVRRRTTSLTPRPT